jgi:hypothetical protein
MIKLTLADILTNKEKIEQVLARHDILPSHFKLFGSIVAQDFPIKAQAHFLVIPGQYTDEEHWNELQDEIQGIFPNSYITFYTPGLLDSMVRMKRIDTKTVARVKQEAIPLN